MRNKFDALLLLVLILWASTAQATVTFIESGGDATGTAGLIAFYASTTGTVAIDNAQSYTGPNSLELSTGSPAVSAFAISPTGLLSDSGSQCSFRIRFDVLPGGTSDILTWRNAAGTTLVRIAMLSTGALRTTPVGATLQTGSTILAVNTWYRITLSGYITNTTTFAFKTYINGAVETTANAGTMTNVTLDNFRLTADSGAGTNHNFWYDDVYCTTGVASSSSQPDTGDVRVTAKRPISNGTSIQFTQNIGGTSSNGASGATGHAVNESERPLSTTFGWAIVPSGGSILTEEYNIENTGAGDVNITTATLLDYLGWVDALSASGSTDSIMLNGSSSGTITLATSSAVFWKMAGSQTYPAGTGTDIGLVTGSTNTNYSLYEAGIVFAFIPGVSGNHNLMLLGVGQ